MFKVNNKDKKDANINHVLMSLLLTLNILFLLTHSAQYYISYRNLQCKSVDWFLYEIERLAELDLSIIFICYVHHNFTRWVCTASQINGLYMNASPANTPREFHVQCEIHVVCLWGH